MEFNEIRPLGAARPLRIIAVLCSLTTVIAATSSTSWARQHRPVAPRSCPPGSFLVYQPQSETSFLAEVKHVATVKLRYAHMFHVPPSRVPNVIQRGLRPVYLHASGYWSVYHVTSRGQFIKSTSWLPRGARIYAYGGYQHFIYASNGDPIVRRPVVRTAPKPQPKPIVHTAPKPQPKPIIHTAPKPQPKPVVHTAPKPQPKPVVHTAPKPQPKPVVHTAPKPQPKPVVRTAPKPQPKPVVKTAPKPQPKPVVKTATKSK